MKKYLKRKRSRGNKNKTDFNQKKFNNPRNKKENKTKIEILNELRKYKDLDKQRQEEIANLKNELSQNRKEIKILNQNQIEMKEKYDQNQIKNKEEIEKMKEKYDQNQIKNKEEIEKMKEKYDEKSYTSFTKYIKEITERYENCNKNTKIKKNFKDDIVDNEITENLLKEIKKINLKEDKYNEPEEKYKNLENFKFKFGQQITNEKLINFIKASVEYINCSYKKKDKKTIKDFFCNKVYKYIYNNLSKKGIRNDLTRDCLITFFFKKKFNKFEYSDSLFLFNKVSEIPLKEIEVGNIKLNKKFLIKAINQPIIINNYIKVCEKYVEDFDSNYYTTYKIIEVLKNHINKMKIYFGELHYSICGLTVSTGDIIINIRFLNGIYSNYNLIKEECLACIFLTILHELAHILTRILKGKKRFQNQFICSVDLNKKKIRGINLKEISFIPIDNNENEIIEEFEKIMGELNMVIDLKAINDNNIFNESGDYFDYNIFYTKSYCQITKEEARYFLNLENFNVNEKDYRKNLENLYNKRRIGITQTAFPIKQNRILFINSIIKGKCAKFYLNKN